MNFEHINGKYNFVVPLEKITNCEKFGSRWLPWGFLFKKIIPLLVLLMMKELRQIIVFTIVVQYSFHLNIQERVLNILIT